MVKSQLLPENARALTKAPPTSIAMLAISYFSIMLPCLISMSLFSMARATSTMTMPTLRGVKSSFGGLPPNRRIVKPGVSHSETRDYRAMIQRDNENFTVGRRSCHTAAV